MTTIDLGTPPPPPAHLLDALPRRVGLTLPELRLVAAAAGDAPLPFDRPDVGRATTTPTAPAPPTMADRLGGTPSGTDDDVLRGVLDALPDPAASLGRRGLLTDGEVDAGLRGAVGLLATPSVAVDLDVVVGAARAVAWHRQDGGAVAALSTVDGVVFELAWFPVSAWAAELGRVAVLPEDAGTVGGSGTAVPASVDLPLEVADAAGEALAAGRADLVPEVLRQSGGTVTADGVVLDEARALDLVRAVHAETRGRLRVLVADVSGDGATGAETDLSVGVRSWVLLADGWRSLRTHDGAVDVPPRVTLTAVDPADLAADLAPLLAQVGHDAHDTRDTRDTRDTAAAR